MHMSQINTFMSHDAVNEDAENTEFERGAWSFVAWSQRGRSSDHISARARHFAAASIPISGARTRNWPCDARRRTFGSGDVQDSPRCAHATSRLFRQQRFDAERDCYPRPREVSDRDAPTSLTWPSDPQRSQRSVWNSSSIAYSPSSCSRFMVCWWRTAFAQ